MTPPKVKATPEKVGETLELLGMDFSNYGKYKAYRNSKGGSMVATYIVQ